MRSFSRYWLWFGLLMSCSQEDPRPLVKSYTKDFEIDLGSRYSVDFPVVGKKSVFHALHINKDGSMVIIHSPQTPPREWTLTKLSPTGEFIEDLTLPEEYPAEISMDDQGNLETLSSNDLSRIIRKWNSDLEVIQTTTIPYPVPPIFTWMRLHKSSYYLGNYAYDAQNMIEWSITRYGLDGTLKWTRKLNEYGIAGLVQPLFFGERDELLFVRFTQDSVRYSKVNGSTGDMIWGRQYPITDFGKYYPSTVPLNNGHVLVVATPDPGVQDDNWSMINPRGAIYYKGRLNFPDEVRPSLVLEEDDGGLLFPVGVDQQTSVASFRLLKLDSKLNLGWVGTFNQLEPGNVTQLKKSNDHVLVLTSNGYLYGLKRKF